jgi:hypothetical protein
MLAPSRDVDRQIVPRGELGRFSSLPSARIPPRSVLPRNLTDADRSKCANSRRFQFGNEYCGGRHSATVGEAFVTMEEGS